MTWPDEKEKKMYKWANVNHLAKKSKNFSSKRFKLRLNLLKKEWDRLEWIKIIVDRKNI